jgi:hypothetical protein
MAEAEHFIMLIQREMFDYTKWQENLFETMSIEELSKKADEYVKNNKNGSLVTADHHEIEPIEIAEKINVTWSR